ncbi:hypothetical protein BKN38_02275 [Helicobacter sp. CLO-3]|uniref:N-acetylmuramoyl-L-alanine amidase family protein n=1 Tax=unclassified Helicobacter TaxID=2593540 RepID=UPI000805800E|nr:MULTISPECIES: N-acetylmuramoyl-L-alanine amidase [unclassified Helicobacter]OBV29462.1 hypothetical protein BA723_00755 [Helicobacter sp. CLO-3]OHU84641.1 hypothetical protein BKN38_02275 [Helicobacter sp. CLO-3]
MWRILLCLLCALTLKAESLHITQSIAFGVSSLKITFSQDIENLTLNPVKISNNSVYIDTKAILDNGKKIYYFPNNAQITIAQNTPQVVRMVLSNGNFSAYQIRAVGKNLYISFLDKIPESKSAQNTQTTQKTQATQTTQTPAKPESSKPTTAPAKPADSKPATTKPTDSKPASKPADSKQPAKQTPAKPAPAKPTPTQTPAQKPTPQKPAPAPAPTIRHNIPSDMPQVKPTKSKKGYKVVIDPGHGGKDCGTLGVNKVCEKNIVLKVAQNLNKELKKRGYVTYMTRDSDVYLNLKERTDFANAKNADLFVSIHANSVPQTAKKSPKGVETYFLSTARSDRARDVAEQENKDDIEIMNFFSKQTFLNSLNSHRLLASNKLAIDIQYSILKQLRRDYQGITDGGVREGPFWVLAGALMPSVLIEIGYNSSPIEAPRLNDAAYQKSLAIGIADGIDGFVVKNF